MLIKTKRISAEYSDIPLPEYSTSGSAGMDIRAAVENKYVLKAGEFGIVPTNLIFEIPEGFEVQVRPRSGLAIKHGIGVLNSPGTIDSDYRGEVKIILFNFSKEDFIINRGERIAQLVLSKVYKAEIEETNSINESSRGSGGFGHTGLK
ncbi:MAG: dUTP diphosphatase [Ignavibacteriales bacterium]